MQARSTRQIGPEVRRFDSKSDFWVVRNTGHGTGQGTRPGHRTGHEMGHRTGRDRGHMCGYIHTYEHTSHQTMKQVWKKYATSMEYIRCDVSHRTLFILCWDVCFILVSYLYLLTK